MSERRDAAKVQDALYRIAELASAAQDLQEFYAAVHAIVGELMYADLGHISPVSVRTEPGTNRLLLTADPSRC